MRGNREYSRDTRATAELPTPRSRGWWRQPDKDEVGGSSPPRPTSTNTLTRHPPDVPRLRRAQAAQVQVQVLPALDELAPLLLLHLAVYCAASPGCRSVWYRPGCERR